MLGALTVLHVSLMSINSLNQNKTAVFSLPLQFLLSEDHITIYISSKWEHTAVHIIVKELVCISRDLGLH